MKLSVVIPFYNAAATLGEQLEALANQSFTGDWELILADNGSNDDSRAVAAAFADRIPDMRVVDASDRRGAAHARNRGAAHATGEALVFCDADDVVCPNWLSLLHEALENHDFVTGPADTSGINSFVQSTKKRSTVRVWTYLPFLPHGISGNMGVKKALHDAIGGFDEHLLAAEDIDYSWRLKIEKNVDVHFLPDAVIFYRLRSTLTETFWQHVRGGEFTVALYKKYMLQGHIPKKSLKEGIKEWLKLLKQWRSWRTAESRARWMRQFGQAVGRLKGSIKERVIAL